MRSAQLLALALLACGASAAAEPDVFVTVGGEVAWSFVLPLDAHLQFLRGGGVLRLDVGFRPGIDWRGTVRFDDLTVFAPPTGDGDAPGERHIYQINLTTGPRFRFACGVKRGCVYWYVQLGLAINGSYDPRASGGPGLFLATELGLGYDWRVARHLVVRPEIYALTNFGAGAELGVGASLGFGFAR